MNTHDRIDREKATSSATAERAHAAQMLALDAAKWFGRALVEAAAGRSDHIESQGRHARQLLLEAVAAWDARPAVVAFTPASRPLPRRVEGGS